MKGNLYAFFFFLLCFLPLGAQATHLRGGYIEYVADKQNPLKLSFRMVIYTDDGSAVQDSWVSISPGDGNSIVVPRQEVFHLGEETSRATYEWEYTYTQPGTYTVSWNGVSRSNGIINIAQPSDQVTLLFQTQVQAGTSNLNRHSARFLAPATAKAYVGQAFKLNLLAYDIDGDSLAYALTTPMCKVYRTEGDKVEPVPGYFIPEGFAIDKTGEINWPNPQLKGEYNFAIQVQEFRKGQVVGTSFLDFQVIVKESNQMPPTVMLLHAEKFKKSKEGYLVVKPGEDVALTYLVKRPARTVLSRKEHYSELFQPHLSDTTYTVTERDTTDALLQTIKFTAPAAARSQPYTVGAIFSLPPANRYDEHVVTRAYTYLLVQEPIPPADSVLTLLHLDKLPKTPEGHLLSTPTETLRLSTFSKSIEGFTTSLEVITSLKENAAYFNFTARDSANGKLGVLLFKPAPEQIRNEPYQILFRSTYTPVALEMGMALHGTTALQRHAGTGQSYTRDKTATLVVSAATPTGTADDLLQAGRIVYPNPAREIIGIEAEAGGSFTLYRANGQQVLRLPLAPGYNKIARPANLVPGFYYYQLSSKGKHTKRGKLLLL